MDNFLSLFLLFFILIYTIYERLQNIISPFPCIIAFVIFQKFAKLKQVYESMRTFYSIQMKKNQTF